jgi:hypothetical protein
MGGSAVSKSLRKKSSDVVSITAVIVFSFPDGEMAHRPVQVLVTLLMCALRTVWRVPKCVELNTTLNFYAASIFFYKFMEFTNLVFRSRSSRS